MQGTTPTHKFKANSMESTDPPPQKLTLGIVSNCSLLPILKAPTGTGTKVPPKPKTSKLRVKLTSNLVKILYHKRNACLLGTKYRVSFKANKPQILSWRRKNKRPLENNLNNCFQIKVKKKKQSVNEELSNDQLCAKNMSALCIHNTNYHYHVEE